MTTEINKLTTAIVGSVALNIFLVAFTLGHIGNPSPPLIPPKPPEIRNVNVPYPPLFIAAMDVLEPEKIKDKNDHEKEVFERMRELRKELGKKLIAAPVKSEEIFAYFTQVNKLYDAIRKNTQKSVSDKIASMPEERRVNFARGFANGS